MKTLHKTAVIILLFLPSIFSYADFDLSGAQALGPPTFESSNPGLEAESAMNQLQQQELETQLLQQRIAEERAYQEQQQELQQEQQSQEETEQNQMNQ